MDLDHGAPIESIVFFPSGEFNFVSFGQETGFRDSAGDSWWVLLEDLGCSEYWTNFEEIGKAS